MGWGESLDTASDKPVVVEQKNVTQTAPSINATTESSTSWGNAIDNTAAVKEDVDIEDEERLQQIALIKARLEELKALNPLFSEEPERSSDGMLLPIADDSIAQPPEERDTSERSGFGPTVEAWEYLTNPLVHDDGTELTDEEVLEATKEMAESIKNPKSGYYSPNRTKIGPLEIAIAKAFESNAFSSKLMLGVVGTINLLGAGAKDTIELVLETLADSTEDRSALLKFNIPLPTGDINTKTIYDGIKATLATITGSDEFDDPEEMVNLFGDMTLGAAEFAETFPAFGGVSYLMSAKGLTIKSQVKGGIKVNAKRKKELADAIRNNYEGARLAGNARKAEAQALAKEIAEQNQDIRDGLILGFESRLSGDIKISKEVNGHLEIDESLTREGGRETLRRPFEIVTEADGTPSVVNDALSKLMGGENGFESPVINPNKLNALVAVISDYKKIAGDNPENPFNDPNVKPIDAIVEITINKGINETQELMDILNKYDMSLEDFILSSVASFSDAGRILQIASQLKRVRPDADIAAANALAVAERAADIANGSQRLENVRRGSLVSKLATAGRNLESFVVRLPMESLVSVMDEVVRSYNSPITLGKNAKRGFLGVAKTVTDADMWKRSFSGWEYAFSRPDVADGFMKLLLDNPQFTTMYNKMYDNLNEIQKAGGRGSGTLTDKLLIPLEDTVEMLNIANRFQEKLTRNAIGMHEIERLVKLEWGIDLRESLNAGMLPDIIRDASTVKPKDARSFYALMSDATERALDVTYGNQPEGDMARTITQALTSKKMFGVIPLTTIVAFPRFMFKSFEYMAQSTAGAASPLVMKLIPGLQKGPLTAVQKRNIQRNIVGGAAIYAAYLYRSSENAPAAFEDVRVMGKDADTTTQFPLRQILYLGEVAKQIKQGTFSEFWDPKVWAETFIGGAMRTGTGNIIIEEIASMADGMDINVDIKAAEVLGELVSNYMSTYFVGPSQGADFERMTGQRPNVYTEKPLPAARTKGEAFLRELKRGPDRMGITLSPAEEISRAEKTTVFPEDSIRPDASWKGLLGINLKDQPSEDQEFVTSLGIQAWKMGSNSDIDTVKIYENKQISKFLPLLIVQLTSQRKKLEKKYDEEPDSTKREISKEAYLLYKTKNLFVDIMSKFKSKLKKISGAKADDFSFKVSSFNRIPKKYRKEAYVDWVVANNGVDPDITDIDMISELLTRARTIQRINQKISSRALGARTQ